MLRRLSIRDFVIVEQSALDFEPGFTVLTGETGAGKSILIDALSLVLGERGDGASVRAGAKQAEVSAEFDLARDQPAAQWLSESGLEGDPDSCLVRRILDAGGRSRAFVNGHSVTVAQLRELGELLVDIHGQHAHQSLLRPASQRELLDAYGGASDLAAEVSAAFRQWQALSERYDDARGDADRLLRERGELAWQVNELTRLDFQLESWLEINAEHARLTHAASLIEAASASLEALSEGEHAASSRVNAVVTRLARASEHDASLRAVLDVLEPAQIQVQEAIYALERYLSRLEVDPQRLAEVESRLQAVHDACRKFRLTPKTLSAALLSAQSRLLALERDLDVTRLEREVEHANRTYTTLAEKLTSVRKIAAAKLGHQVSAAIQELALVGGRFDVVLDPLAQATLNGLERIEFRIASHVGLEPGPLAKVASGGELSRVSLAIQGVLSQVAHVPTLIFDEVDAGIGGRVAEIVGQMLHRLGARHQVMCVTHLAQVAVCADHHWSVAKVEQLGQVASNVEALSSERRVDEIARMLGGLKVTRATLDHASEMLRGAARRGQAK